MSMMKFWGQKKPKEIEKKGYFADPDNVNNEYLRQVFRSISANSRLIDFPKYDRNKFCDIYKNNNIVFSVVNRCADVVAKVSRYVELVDKEDNTIDDHWALSLFQRPNDLDSTNDMIRAWAINRMIFGDAFVYGMPGAGLRSGERIGLYVIPSQNVLLKCGGLTAPIKGITLIGNMYADEIDMADVMFSRNYNPDIDEYYGLSPLVSAAKLTTIIDNGLKRQNTSISNGGVSTIVTPKSDGLGGVTPMQRENVEEDLNSSHNGNYTSFFRSPIEVHSIGDTPVSLGILDSSDAATAAICFVYGYPYSLYKSDTTFNNQNEAKRVLIENVGLPMLEEFLQKYTAFCGFDKGERFIINTDRIEELKVSVFDMLNAYDKAFRSYNDRAELLELPKIDEPWADEPIFPINVIPGNPTAPTLPNED